MKRSRRTFFVAVAAIAASAGSLFYFGTQGQLPDVVTDLIEPDYVSLTIANSVTKQKWLEDAAASFDSAGIRTASGRRIDIEIKPVLSGDSLEKILRGEMQTGVWSPGEQVWMDQLTEGWKRQTAKPIMSAACTPTVYTPVGFAIWRPMAEALGWPDKQIGWKSIIDLANNPEGWGSLGHPEWGRLKLGHTNPQYSNAGLLFMASVIYEIIGKTTDVTTSDVYSPRVDAALAALAQNTAKYGIVTTDLLNRMAESGPDFLHVVSAFEEGTVRFNIERKNDLRWPLAFVFPKEGTFWSNHPYCILDGANWVSPEQAEAARLFRNYLLTKEQQTVAAAHFLRPLDSRIPLGGGLSVANGTDPAVNASNSPVLSTPDAAVSKSIIDQFLASKRKATVLLVLDVSGSMNEDNSFRTATEATKAFLDRLDARDRVGLATFSSQVTLVSGIKPVAEVAETLSQTVLGLSADGSKSLYDAVCAGARVLTEERNRDAAANEARLYGMVVLSDGEDQSSKISENEMFETCLPHGPEAEGTRLFTIAFGDEAGTEVLRRMAQVTGGATYSADPESIDGTYLKISAEQ